MSGGDVPCLVVTHLDVWTKGLLNPNGPKVTLVGETLMGPMKT